MVTKALNPNKKDILNILTGKGEIGSCALMAAGGRYISKKEPIEGYCEELGIKSEPGVPITEVCEGIEVMALQARYPDGKVVDHTQNIEGTLS